MKEMLKNLWNWLMGNTSQRLAQEKRLEEALEELKDSSEKLAVSTDQRLMMMRGRK